MTMVLGLWSEVNYLSPLDHQGFPWPFFLPEFKLYSRICPPHERVKSWCGFNIPELCFFSRDFWSKRGCGLCFWKFQINFFFITQVCITYNHNRFFLKTFLYHPSLYPTYTTTICSDYNIGVYCHFYQVLEKSFSQNWLTPNASMNMIILCCCQSEIPTGNYDRKYLTSDL
jgi:hypothetical protein